MSKRLLKVPVWDEAIEILKAKLPLSSLPGKLIQAVDDGRIVNRAQAQSFFLGCVNVVFAGNKAAALQRQVIALKAQDTTRIQMGGEVSGGC